MSQPFFRGALFGFMLLFLTEAVKAQSVTLPYNADYYHLIDRYAMLSGHTLDSSWHGSIRPLGRDQVAKLGVFAMDTLLKPNLADRFNLQYLIEDNWGYAAERSVSPTPFLKKFFIQAADMYHVVAPDFFLRVNPVAYFSVGQDPEWEKMPFQNTRGVQIEGKISDKVGFYTLVSDNQLRGPNYAWDFVNRQQAIPGEIFWKDHANGGGDFFHAAGHISFQLVKNIDLQFGQGRHFIGNGHRSIFLSDFAPNYAFMRLNTKVWKLNYTNIFAKMTAEYDRGIGTPYPSKYFAMHHLSLNVSPKLNIGLFESVVFGRTDSLSAGFDIFYLNPVIFYRAVEHQLGDADNVNIGLDFKWDARNNFRLYGQFLIDDMNIAEITAGNGWFANRFAGQLGFKYLNIFGAPNVDWQSEFNVVTPYTYAHFEQNVQFSNYQHYNQPLAHPLGANFTEFVNILRIQPSRRLSMVLKSIYANMGRDRAGENWGGNIFLNYMTREQDYNNKLGQGVDVRMMFNSLTFTYQVKHNMFFDFTATYRSEQQKETGDIINDRYLGMSFRWNLPVRLFEY